MYRRLSCNHLHDIRVYNFNLEENKMKTPRCTKCKYFCRSKAKRKVYDRGNGYSESAPSLIDALGTYYCPHKWWNISSLKEIKNGDVCNDFKFK